ncbi:hypothetical protein NEOLEDRAFT_985977 [Neolentinus lepideus HHB14362 ss-1]|uniref:F-box domain-containing protein n=1 Tax=Neolentinus lepideus HHB14362 ss-1 TaxID=1314782 RepID=A0A165N4Z9_9AGAM|nr:hypothetical protein NEOLEDRAFT_985977 [Neolentinus lepideus HHB14362 ss-1]
MTTTKAADVDMSNYRPPKLFIRDAPEHIIGDIASYVVEGVKTQEDEPAPARKWFPILGVCRKWRNAIQRHAEVWAEVVIGSIESLQIFLARSRNRPLTIKGTLASADSTSDVTKLDMIMDHAARLRSLRLTDISRAVWERLEWATIYSQTPNLEELEVRRESLGIEHTDVLSRRFISDKFLRLWFSGFHYDDLRSLLLPSLPQLTSLTLVNVESSPTISQVMDILRETVVLESLTLGVQMARSPNTRQAVHLPVLTSLVVYTFCGPTEIEIFWTLDAPSLGCPCFKIIPYGNLNHKFEAAGEIVAYINGRTPIKGWTLVTQEPGTSYCMLTPDASGTTHEMQSGGIRFWFDGFGIEQEQIVVHMLRTYLLRRTTAVTHLTVDNARGDTTDELVAWVSLFLSMPGITSLEISGEHSTAFADGMFVPDAPGTIRHPLFPVLRDVAL